MFNKISPSSSGLTIMCQRIAQYRRRKDYAVDMGWFEADANAKETMDRLGPDGHQYYNLGTDRSVTAIHALNFGCSIKFTGMRWG
jgi:hypothetical protein